MKEGWRPGGERPVPAGQTRRLIDRPMHAYTIELDRISVKVLGYDGFRFRLPREAKLLAECLRAMAKRCPPAHFKVDGLP